MTKRDTLEQLLQNTRAQLSSVGGPNHVKLNKVILPIIRKVMPSVIAQQIAGVQPMTGAFGINIPRPPAIPRPEAWSAKGMWVMFDCSLEPWQRDYYNAWCDGNVDTYLPDDDCYFFETTEDALMFWLRFG